MSQFRHLTRWLWACGLTSVGAIAAARRKLSGRRAIVVLALHRVLSDSELARTNSLSGIVLRDHTFTGLADYVSRRFETVDVSRCAPGGPASGLRLAFTFDDGWRDNYISAFPIARAFGIPMTIFLCPGLLERSTPFWPERVAAELRARRPRVRWAEVEAAIEDMKLVAHDTRESAAVAPPALAQASPGPEDHVDSSLSWAEAAEMDRAGVVFGAHTQTHQVLTTVSGFMAQSEIEESRAEIVRVLGKPCDIFAYPNGNHSPATRRILARAGFSRAFTMDRGAWTVSSDPLAIPRINVAEDDVTGPRGRFSRALFNYTVIWKTFRAGCR
jgi:peptidoglycan/xylan/chitin deacetylase (PgdA/CDA1 family)